MFLNFVCPEELIKKLRIAWDVKSGLDHMYLYTQMGENGLTFQVA